MTDLFFVTLKRSRTILTVEKQKFSVVSGPATATLMVSNDITVDPVMLSSGGFKVCDKLHQTDDVDMIRVPTNAKGESQIDYSALGSTKAEVLSAIIARYFV